MTSTHSFPAPDTIIIGARALTVDRENSWIEAFAISSSLIIATGTNAEILELAGEHTRVIDVEGKMIMPGIVDVHSHLVLGGQQAAWELPIQPTWSIDEVLQAVVDAARELPLDSWIVGGIIGSLAMNEIVDSSYLARLDAAAGGRPVLLRDDTQHNRWVNSVTLALMGVDGDTPNIAGGEYVRDSQGNLTGVMWELASRHAEETAVAGIPGQDHRNQISAAESIRIMNSYGVTATQESATFESALRAFSELDQAGALNAWVVGSMPARDFVVGVGAVGEPLFDSAEQYRTAHVRPDFVKAVVDGIPMSYTATFLEPYKPGHHHDACFRGVSYFTMPELVDLLDTCYTRGLGCKMHATGDGSVHEILDAVEIIRNLRGPGPTFHIAHVEFVTPEDVPRFAALNVVPDVSPAMWFPSPMSTAIDAVINKQVMARMWPLRELVASGALLSAGSDWPCALPTPDPWVGIETMVTRANPDPAFPGTLNPDQSLGLLDVLRAYTQNPATAMGLGDITGSLEIGKAADFIVLDRNLFEIAPDEVHLTVVEQTWFGGTLVSTSVQPRQRDVPTSKAVLR